MQGLLVWNTAHDPSRELPKASGPGLPAPPSSPCRPSTATATALSGHPDPWGRVQGRVTPAPPPWKSPSSTQSGSPSPMTPQRHGRKEHPRVPQGEPQQCAFYKTTPESGLLREQPSKAESNSGPYVQPDLVRCLPWGSTIILGLIVAPLKAGIQWEELLVDRGVSHGSGCSGFWEPWHRRVLHPPGWSRCSFSFHHLQTR